MAHANAVPVSGSKLDNRRVLAALIDLVIVGRRLRRDPGRGREAGRCRCRRRPLRRGDRLGALLLLRLRVGRRADGRQARDEASAWCAPTAPRPACARSAYVRSCGSIDGLFLYLVGLVVMLVTRERRGRLGDLVGGTMIVSADKPAPAVDMSAPEAPASAPRVPIAESGPAFAEPEAAEVAEVEAGAERGGRRAASRSPSRGTVAPELASSSVEPEPSDRRGARPERRGREPRPRRSRLSPRPTSPTSLRSRVVELASDVTAVTEDPEREVEEEEPEVEEQIAPRPRPRPRPGAGGRGDGQVRGDRLRDRPGHGGRRGSGRQVRRAKAHAAA